MNTGTSTEVQQAIEEGERLFARIWRLLALRGAVAIIFAVVLLVWPDIGLSAMTIVVGAFAIASGFVSGVAAWALPGAASHRLWLGFNSIVGLAVGVGVLVWPDLSAKALLYAIAIWAIATGVTELYAAIALPLSGARTVLTAVSGVVMAGFGILMFVEPDEGAIALLALVAAFAFVRGTLDIALAVELRHVLGDVKERFRSPARPTPITG
jgi:uncharacterized membrane protein HdeD (DUF308 family)